MGNIIAHFLLVMSVSMHNAYETSFEKRRLTSAFVALIQAKSANSKANSSRYSLSRNLRVSPLLIILGNTAIFIVTLGQFAISVQRMQASYQVKCWQTNCSTPDLFCELRYEISTMSEQQAGLGQTHRALRYQLQFRLSRKICLFHNLAATNITRPTAS